VKRLAAAVALALASMLLVASPAHAVTECRELHAPGDQEICFRTVALYANGDVKLRVFFRGENLGWVNENAGYNGQFTVPYKYGTHDIWGSTLPKSGKYSPILCCARPSHLNYAVTVRLNNWPDDRVTGQMPWN
jgi:hypothetical protein